MISNLDKAKRKLLQYKTKIDSSTGCILGISSIQSNGYIKIKFNKRYTYMHRLVAYIYFNLDLTDIMKFICHIRECPNKHCINKDHLYIGNAKTNALDYMSTGNHHEAMKTLCDYGHKLDSSMFTKRDGRVRYCSVCRRNAQKKLKEKK